MDEILDKKNCDGKIYYLVKWRSFEEWNWIEYDNFDPGCLALVQKFDENWKKTGNQRKGWKIKLEK